MAFSIIIFFVFAKIQKIFFQTVVCLMLIAQSIIYLKEIAFTVLFSAKKQ